MKLHSTTRLSDQCKIALAKTIFDRNIDVESEKVLYERLRDFIVHGCLPKSVLLPIVRILLIYLDRGYNRQQLLKPPCEDASREGFGVEEEEEARSLTDGDVNDLGRRQRASWITTICVDHLVARWGDERLYPEDLLNDDELAPRAMSMRGRQAIVMHLVESFIAWTYLLKDNQNELCSECNAYASQWASPPKVLNLCTTHGNWSGTRVALAAISSSLKAIEISPQIPSKRSSICSKCDKRIDSATSEQKEIFQDRIKGRRRGGRMQEPVIKLDIVLMGSIQDWVVDVLLFALKNSPSKGFNIEISAIRSEDLELPRFCDVLDSLALPQKVQSLEYRTKDPKSIFAAGKSLRRLTGLESFVFAHLWRQSQHRTLFTADECRRFTEEISGQWVHLSKLRFEGVVPFSDFSLDIYENDNLSRACSTFLPHNLRILEFAHDSLTVETLNWLLSLCDKQRLASHRSTHNLSSIQTLRFENETSLSCSEKAWNLTCKFLGHVRSSLRTLAVDHCGITESQCVALQSVIGRGDLDGRNPVIAQSPLQHVTIRESGLTAKSTLDMHEAFCVAVKYRVLPQFAYFACLLPAADDPFWFGKANPQGKQNVMSCPFEKRLRSISASHGCPHIAVETFWEPSESEFQRGM